MLPVSRPSRRQIEQVFYQPIAQGEGQRVELTTPDAGLLLIGYILRWQASYFVVGPDFGHLEDDLRLAIITNAVDQLGQGEARAAQVHRFSSLQESVGCLCDLVDQAFGPEGEPTLDHLDELDEQDLLEEAATPDPEEDPTYAERD